MRFRGTTGELRRGQRGEGRRQKSLPNGKLAFCLGRAICAGYFCWRAVSEADNDVTANFPRCARPLVGADMPESPSYAAPRSRRRACSRVMKLSRHFSVGGRGARTADRLGLGAVCRRKPEPRQSERRRQTLDEHRKSHDREGDNQDVLALGDVRGQRESEGQRQRPAQSAPPQQVLLIERNRPARVRERQAHGIDRQARPARASSTVSASARQPSRTKSIVAITEPISRNTSELARKRYLAPLREWLRDSTILVNYILDGVNSNRRRFW